MQQFKFSRWPINLILILLILSITQNVRASQDKNDGSIGPDIAFDENPALTIVEVRLVAEEKEISLGTDGAEMVRMYTYNGLTPGPTIEANVGDTLIVHFENRLPEATTIHWHGVELPANMDGSNIAQFAVPPGGSYRYKFKLPDASTFWYHPHIASNEQIEKGLYGALVVRDRARDLALGLPENEHVILLDDILLDDYGQVAEAFPSDPLENAETQVNGREGNYLLANGRVSPALGSRSYFSVGFLHFRYNETSPG